MGKNGTIPKPISRNELVRRIQLLGAENDRTASLAQFAFLALYKEDPEHVVFKEETGVLVTDQIKKTKELASGTHYENILANLSKLKKTMDEQNGPKQQNQNKEDEKVDPNE